MTSPLANRPDPARSAALRAVVQRKRARGQLTESLILMRMGVQASRQAGAAQGLEPDDVSRLALQRYLELMPDDTDVRRALHALGEAPAGSATGSGTDGPPAPTSIATSTAAAPATLPVPPAPPAPGRLRGLWARQHRLVMLLGLPVAGLVAAGLASAGLRPWEPLSVWWQPPAQSVQPAQPAQQAVQPPGHTSPVATPPADAVVAAAQRPPSPAASAPANAVVAAPAPPASTTTAPTAEDSQPIVIRAVGDVVLGSDYPEHRLPTAADRQRITALRRELRQADVVVGNLEGVLSDTGASRKDARKPGLYTFRMPTSYALTLRDMGFDVMSLANNHSMDFGAQGLASTLAALRANGIAPMGVPGAEVATVTVRGTRVAFLNYSYLPAFVRMDDARRITADIVHARASADWVVVSVHGGREGQGASGLPQGDEYFMQEYRGDLARFARMAIDAGASAVLGHGPHVVRPFELYRGKPVFYSLGNFVGYRSLSTQGKLAHSIVAEVRFSPQGELLGAGIIPLKLDRSGIPVVDYSPDNLQALSGLLLEKLDHRPVLNLSVNTTTQQ